MSQEIDTSNYIVLAMTANFWVTGSATTPYDTIVRRLRGYAGSKHVTKHGCVLYSVHPDYEIDCVNGTIYSPAGHKATKLEDRRPVEWSKDGARHVGKLPGDRVARLTVGENGPLGRMIWIEVDGRQTGSVGGGDPRTLLKRAKAEAEKTLKLDRKSVPVPNEAAGK